MMKKYIYLLFLPALLLASCEEKNSLINLQPGDYLYVDTSYTGSAQAKQNKNVLIEDFTGVKCTNCPTAQEKAKAIIDAYPGRVVVTSIHVTEDFGHPYPESKEDYRIVEGENIATILGESFSQLPIGDIDRVKFPASTQILVPYTNWESYTVERLGHSTPANVTFQDIDYNESSRELKVLTEVSFTEDASGPYYITLALTESGIIDLQKTPDFTNPVDSNYEHNHLLRRIIQPANGLKLADNFKAGNTYVIGFTTKLPAHWVADNMHVVAYVHRRSDTDREVVQVQEKEIK